MHLDLTLHIGKLFLWQFWLKLAYAMSDIDLWKGSNTCIYHTLEPSKRPTLKVTLMYSDWTPRIRWCFKINAMQWTTSFAQGYWIFRDVQIQWVKEKHHKKRKLLLGLEVDSNGKRLPYFTKSTSSSSDVTWLTNNSILIVGVSRCIKYKRTSWVLNDAGLAICVYVIRYELTFRV